MSVMGEVKVDLYRKTVLYCPGMGAGLLGSLFRTPVVISDAYDLSSREVVGLGQQVQCICLESDGNCAKNGTNEKCFLLEPPLRA